MILKKCQSKFRNAALSFRFIFSFFHLEADTNFGGYINIEENQLGVQTKQSNGGQKSSFPLLTFSNNKYMELDQNSYLTLLFPLWTDVMCLFRLTYQQRICHIFYIGRVSFTHELMQYVNSSYIFVKICSHKLHIWMVLCLHELMQCVNFLSHMSHSNDVLLSCTDDNLCHFINPWAEVQTSKEIPG